MGEKGWKGLGVALGFWVWGGGGRGGLGWAGLAGQGWAGRAGAWAWLSWG